MGQRAMKRNSSDLRVSSVYQRAMELDDFYLRWLDKNAI